MNQAARITPRRRRLTSAAVTGLLALGLVGCATSARRTAESEAQAIVIEVDNNLVPAMALTVWAVPDGGTQTMIGNVGPAERKALRYVPTSRALTYRLRARLTGGRDLLSNPISMVDAQRVTWNVQSNLATVRDGG